MGNEEQAKAALAKKRAEAEERKRGLALLEEGHRDVPPGIETTEAAEREANTKYAAACAAFVKAQSEFKPISFDKENPHFKSKYASLSAILKATLPALNANGIAHTSRTVIDGENIVVKAYLIHGGIPFVRAEWPAGKISTPPQQLGSALTYARRYALQSVLGVAAEEDDDGNAAQGKPSKASEVDPF